MTRGPRWEQAGGLHHVTTRAPKGLVLFKKAVDGDLYLRLLFAEVMERGWSLRSYCLMTNHVHFLVMTPEADLGDGMKRIHERFAMRMHQRYEGYGAVFGARFKNKPVLTAEHEIACLRYIARNPVEAGMCARPEDYRWSAHRYLAGLEPAPEVLDVAAARAALPLPAYLEVTGTSDADFLDRLAAEAPETWLAEAIDLHCFPVGTVAAHSEMPQSTFYKRLRQAREKRV